MPDKPIRSSKREQQREDRADNYNHDKLVLELEIGKSLAALLEKLFENCEPNNSKQILKLLKELKNMNAETVKILEDLDAASTELAADIQTLIDKANENGTLTAAEINAALAPKVEFLKQLGTDTNAPIPPVSPPAEPTA